MSRDDSRSRWFEPALFQHRPPEECRELLAAKSVGRVGFNGPDGPQVLPVNYVVHRRGIFFRTAVGSALSAATRSSRAASWVTSGPMPSPGISVAGIWP